VQYVEYSNSPRGVSRFGWVSATAGFPRQTNNTPNIHLLVISLSTSNRVDFPLGMRFSIGLDPGLINRRHAA
jgi:hypothetical protein